jgi:hypothetical protein
VHDDEDLDRSDADQVAAPMIAAPEPWRHHHGITWSHWDRWACVVAVVDHDGDLSGLEARLRNPTRQPGLCLR